MSVFCFRAVCFTCCVLLDGAHCSIHLLACLFLFLVPSAKAAKGKKTKQELEVIVNELQMLLKTFKRFAVAAACTQQDMDPFINMFEAAIEAEEPIKSVCCLLYFSS